MKNVLLFFTGVLLMGLTQAQNSRFLTIDAENLQPFSVQFGKKVYSSSSVGHLVMANLPDSSFIIQFNFPQNKFKEQRFLIAADSRDHGIQLKKTGADSWALFDWQSLDLLQPILEKQPESEVPVGAELRTDGFARLMAAVVNDSAILVNTASKATMAKKAVITPAAPVIASSEGKLKAEIVADSSASSLVKNEPPAIVQPPIVAKDTETVVPSTGVVVTKMPVDTVAKTKVDVAVASSSSDVVITRREVDSFIDTRNKLDSPIIKKDPIVVPPVISKEQPDKSLQKVVAIQSLGLVRKIFDNTGKEWRDQRYRDSSESGVDTISIKIPLETEMPVAPVVPTQKMVPLQESKKTVADSVVKEPQKEVIPVSKDSIVVAAPKLVMVNSDCRAVATDNDLDKLRVKMLAETGVEERILLAKKAFKAKCYYTRQIKALSELFFTDESRYQFLDAAYPFVVDTDNFKSLVELLSDAYYINRFKAMVRL